VQGRDNREPDSTTNGIRRRHGQYSHGSAWVQGETFLPTVCVHVRCSSTTDRSLMSAAWHRNRLTLHMMYPIV
jgi:hypothetical protein